MNILIISYVNTITEQAKEAIIKKYENAIIKEVNDILHAKYELVNNDYDFIVIDTTVRENCRIKDKNLTEPTVNFLMWLKTYFPEIGAFALFDETETGKECKKYIQKLDYEVNSWNMSSIEWCQNLIKCI